MSYYRRWGSFPVLGLSQDSSAACPGSLGVCWPTPRGSGSARCFGHGTRTSDRHHRWAAAAWACGAWPGLLCFCQEKERTPGNTTPLPGTQGGIRDTLWSRPASDPRPALSPRQWTCRPRSASVYSEATETSEHPRIHHPTGETAVTEFDTCDIL